MPVAVTWNVPLVPSVKGVEAGLVMAGAIGVRLARVAGVVVSRISRSGVRPVRVAGARAAAGAVCARSRAGSTG